MGARHRFIGLVAALAVALLGGLFGRGPVAEWLAVAGALAAIGFSVPWLAPRARELVSRAERRAPRLVRAAPATALIVAALVPFRGLLSGEVPLGHDHPVHLARAWHFVNESLGRGRLHGFSDLWFAGWPSGYDYPIGGDLWVSTFYLATFGALGWTLTYGVAIAAMYATVVHAHYTFGRVFLGRAGGLVVGALALLERGAGNEGGWHYTLDWGVWPFSLGMAFVLYTLSSLDGVAREGGPRRIALAALPAAFSIFCHPFAIVAYGMAVPLFVVTRQSENGWVRPAARCAAALGLGVALSAAWLFPFVASGEWFLRFGDLHVPVEEVARRLLRGELYGWAPWVAVVAVVGAVMSFRRRFGIGVFCVGLALVALLVSSRTFVEALDLGAYSSSLMRIPFQRMAYLAKPAVFLLVAIALVGARRSGGTVESADPAEHAKPLEPRAPWPMPYVVIVALGLAPLILPLLSHSRAYVATFEITTDVPLEGELRAFGEWLDTRRGEDPDFFRVAYIDGSEDHDLKAAVVFTGRPALHSGFTPATTYRHRYDRVDPALYRVLGVRYVVTRAPLAEPWAEPLGRFGRLHVHALREPSTDRVTLVSRAGETLSGPSTPDAASEGSESPTRARGRVDVLRFEPEGAGIELDVSGAQPGDRLVLHVGNFASWRAWRDGAPLEIEGHALAGHDGFVSVAAGNGRTRVAFVRAAPENTGLVVSLLGVLTIGFLLARSRWPERTPAFVARVDERARAFVRSRARQLRWLAVGIAVLAVVGLVVAGLTRPPPSALVDRLAEIQVDLVTPGQARRCEREGDRHACSDEEWNYVGRKYQWFAYPNAVHPTEGEVRRCVWAHPVVDADLTLRVPGVRLGETLEGGHALMNRGSGRLTLTAYVDGEPLGEVAGPTGAAYVWRPFTIPTGDQAGRVVDVELVVRSTGAGAWHYCLDAELPSAAR